MFLSLQSRLGQIFYFFGEMFTPASVQYHANPYLYDVLKTNWTDFAAKTFFSQYFIEKPLSKKILDKIAAIAEFYFKNGIEFESQEGFQNLTDAFGDSGFLYGTHLMAEYVFGLK